MKQPFVRAVVMAELRRARRGRDAIDWHFLRLETGWSLKALEREVIRAINRSLRTASAFLPITPDGRGRGRRSEPPRSFETGPGRTAAASPTLKFWEAR
jgi:hypothetical protein